MSPASSAESKSATSLTLGARRAAACSARAGLLFDLRVGGRLHVRQRLLWGPGSTAALLGSAQHLPFKLGKQHKEVSCGRCSCHSLAEAQQLEHRLAALTPLVCRLPGGRLATPADGLEAVTSWRHISHNDAGVGVAAPALTTTEQRSKGVGASERRVVSKQLCVATHPHLLQRPAESCPPPSRAPLVLSFPPSPAGADRFDDFMRCGLERCAVHGVQQALPSLAPHAISCHNQAPAGGRQQNLQQHAGRAVLVLNTMHNAVCWWGSVMWQAGGQMGDTACTCLLDVRQGQHGLSNLEIPNGATQRQPSCSRMREAGAPGALAAS